MPSLELYNKKRDFTKTPEPPGSKGDHESQIFTIQKHAANRLHFDFRLAIDGVLKSWAVPKGPSLDPGVKRLAVHVEDHPLSYHDFEGTIPAGEYGGGTVLLWDHGTYEPLNEELATSYRKGKLKFRLHGQRLRGLWTLVKIRRDEAQDNWLLMKDDDEFAVHADGDEFLKKESSSVLSGRSLEEIAKGVEQVSLQSSHLPNWGEQLSSIKAAKRDHMPDRVSPQLAKLSTRVPDGDKWLHELKYDGYRIHAHIQDRKVRLITRGGLDWSDKFPDIGDALRSLPVSSAILDGELVVFEKDGSTNFQALQNSITSKKPIKRHYCAFDLLYLDGFLLTDVPLCDRKAVLQELLSQDVVRSCSIVKYSDHQVGRGSEVFNYFCSRNLEGVVSKRLTSSYEGQRSSNWIKTKCSERQEFVVGGWTDPKGERGALGALLLGVYRDGKLWYVGRVGTGFTDNTLEDLLALLTKRERKTTPFHDPPRGREAQGVHWARADLVCEVEFLGWTDDGRLRHPSFKGLRSDKKAKDITLEKGHSEPDNHRQVSSIKLSSPDKILYAEQGITKRTLAEYYERAASHILPYISGRPLSIVRCPQGTDKKCFFQKHLDSSQSHGVRLVESPSNNSETLIVIDDIDGLMSLVQLGVLEIHNWGSTIDDLSRPTHLVFDLDPGDGITFADVRAAAWQIRDFLIELNLTSFVKTTGGKGLHVSFPIKPTVEWDEAKRFMKATASVFEKHYPDRFVAVATKSKRKGRIYIDYLRNAQGATSIANYSTRARHGAPIARPLFWEELNDVKAANEFTIFDTLPTIDPWMTFGSIDQQLPTLED